jgi:hypothetical protein
VFHFNPLHGETEMSKMLVTCAALTLCLLSGCAAVVVRERPCHHPRVVVVPACPKLEQPPKPPVGPDTGASLYFFRLGW